MKLLMLFFPFLMVNYLAAQVVAPIEIGNFSFCETVLDSLRQTSYFDHSVVLPADIRPAELSIRSSGVGGCLFAVYGNSEVLYNGEDVYYLTESAGKFKVKKQEPDHIFSILNILNSTYAMDQKILIWNPRFNAYTTGAYSEKINIKVVYPNGDTYQNEIQYTNSSSFCKYLPEFLNFLNSGTENSENVNLLSMAELSQLLDSSHSLIAKDFVHCWLDTIPVQKQRRMLTDPICRDRIQKAYVDPEVSQQQREKVYRDYFRKHLDYNPHGIRPVYSLPSLDDYLFQAAEISFLLRTRDWHYN